jgi:hypothetical protein
MKKGNMKIDKFGYIALIGSILFFSSTLQAAIVTFDTLVAGATSFGYDGDGDTTDDVIFSTTDPLGFNTVGPGSNMSYIDQPGLEGTTLLSTDLRVDFLHGAVTNLTFGFAQNLTVGGIDGVTFSVFDNTDTLLNSSFLLSDFTLPNGSDASTFPEALLSINFGGIASYALFDFTSINASRYIIDNFSGTFGSTEDISPVPVPAAVWLFGTALIGFVGMSRRRKVA